MSINFNDKVAIVTGAGNGLGRSHALALAARGAKVVINDLGGARDGSGGSLSAAETVVEEIRAAGGEAMANGANVANFDEVQQMVEDTKVAWGKIDILVNNAGILRDATFAKGSLEDFWTVLDVHVRGTVNCTKAVWDDMCAQNYGRIVLTASASGLYGNFGQANYGTAKAAMLGFMNVLSAEGERKNVKVNILAPTAATRMTEELLPAEISPLLSPETITPGVLYLASDDAPSKTILGAGAGIFAVTHIYESEGIFLTEEERTPEVIAARFAEISNPAGQAKLDSAASQTIKYIQKAAKALGIKLPV